MKPFIYMHWHAWTTEGAKVLLSDEQNKQLHSFDDTDLCVNWLFIHNHKEAARALHMHVLHDHIQ